MERSEFPPADLSSQLILHRAAEDGINSPSGRTPSSSSSSHLSLAFIFPSFTDRMPMLLSSLVPLMGGILFTFLFPAAVYSKPTSFSVSTRSGGVQFVDGPLTAENIGIHTADNTAVCLLRYSR